MISDRKFNCWVDLKNIVVQKYRLKKSFHEILQKKKLIIFFIFYPDQKIEAHCESIDFDPIYFEAFGMQLDFFRWLCNANVDFHITFENEGRKIRLNLLEGT